MSDNQSASELSGDPRIGACVYLLHGLLQRLDQTQPGLIDEMTESVEFDLSAIDPSDSPSAVHGALVAEEALRMLRLMAEQRKLASSLKSNS
jgi:hypothetical protein